MRPQVEIAADIVLAQVTDGCIPADLYIEGHNAGISVDVLAEQAEGLYELSQEQFEEACN